MAARSAAAEAGEPEIAFADRVEGAPHPSETRHLHGQQAAEAAFLEALSAGRLAHGWLLAGPRGVGKATLAYRIARRLIAEGAAPAATLAPPEECPVATRIRAGAEPSLRVLRRSPNPETRRLRTEIVVDDVRGVRRFLSYAQPGGGWRAVIVDAADEMNRNAANALLKVLEEPPARTLLLLVSHAPARLLPTIRSRCRRLDLRPLGPEALGAALADAGHPVAPAAAARLATLSGGSVGTSVALVGGDGLALYAGIVEALAGGRVARGPLLSLADLGAGREGRERAAGLLELTTVLLSRMARAAAAGPPEIEAAPGEHALMALAARPSSAADWAEAASRIAAGAARARAVNLDPGQTILDTFLDLDAVLERTVRS